MKFIDYGNEEEGVDLERIYRLPASLEKLDALCVKVKISNMDGVKEYLAERPKCGSGTFGMPKSIANSEKVTEL